MARTASKPVDPLAGKHGLTSTYSHGGCRCDECRAAWAAYNANLRTRLATRKPPRHNDSAYHNYACRCWRCKKAHKAAHAPA